MIKYLKLEIEILIHYIDSWLLLSNSIKTTNHLTSITWFYWLNKQELMSVWVQSWSEYCWASVLNPVCPHLLNLTVGKVAGLATHLCIHCVAPLSSQVHQTLNRTIFWLKCSQQDQNYVDCCDTATVFGFSLQSLPQGFNHITSRT